MATTTVPIEDLGIPTTEEEPKESFAFRHALLVHWTDRTREMFKRGRDSVWNVTKRAALFVASVPKRVWRFVARHWRTLLMIVAYLGVLSVIVGIYALIFQGILWVASAAPVVGAVLMGLFVFHVVMSLISAVVAAAWAILNTE